MNKLLLLGLLLSSFLFNKWTIQPQVDKWGKPYKYPQIIECKDKTGKFQIYMDSNYSSGFAIYKFYFSNEKHTKKDIIIEFQIDKNKVIKNSGTDMANGCILVHGTNFDKNIKTRLKPSFIQLINEMKDGKELKISVRIDGINELIVFPLENFKEVYEQAKFIIY